MTDMLRSWITARPAGVVFLSAPGGEVTYGDLAGRAATGTGQVVIEPGDSLQGVVDLMTLPGSGRQAVVLDPALPAAESERRLGAAGEASSREACTILFTSGSTGPAKAVRLTEANWAAAAASSAAHLDHRGDDVWLAAMPLHHVGGLSILYRSASVGASVRWLPRFEVEAFCRELRSGVTLASVVPTMLRRVLDRDNHSYAGLRAVLVGGAPVPAGLLEEAHSRGIPALPTYGMTETCAQVATLRPGSGVRYAAEPLPGIEVDIGPGGRIALRGPQLSPGYADTDDRPAAEWFVTPDLGELEADGLLRVLGRADEMIISGGENVSPARVETVLRLHPDVEDVVVVGVDDPEWGQRVAAAYTGSAAPDDLARWAAPRLAACELPRSWRRVGEIPLGGAGKPDRSLARRLFR